MDINKKEHLILFLIGGYDENDSPIDTYEEMFITPKKAQKMIEKDGSEYYAWCRGFTEFGNPIDYHECNDESGE